MIKIYHNPLCSKSREAKQLLESKNMEFEIIEYIKHPISKAELKQIIEQLDIQPIELVRQKEAIWKDNFKDKNLSDDEILDAMIEHPRLMERPIIVIDDKAVIGRPTSLILNIL